MTTEAHKRTGDASAQKAYRGGRMGEYIYGTDGHEGHWLTGEEIVRCRDCRHYTEDEMEYYHYCNSWCEQVEPDGFCAWGERKEDGDD